MLEQAEETSGVRAETTLADAGYHSGANLEECDRKGRQVVMPEAQGRALENPYHKDRFAYDETNDRYRCPEGQWLRFMRIKRTRQTKMRLYRASGAVCRACPAFGICTTDRRHGRALEIGPRDAALRRHRAWMSTEEAKEAYRHRKQLVEPVFGDHQGAAASPKIPVARPGQRCGGVDTARRGVQHAHPMADMACSVAGSWLQTQSAPAIQAAGACYGWDSSEKRRTVAHRRVSHDRLRAGDFDLPAHPADANPIDPMPRTLLRQAARDAPTDRRPSPGLVRDVRTVWRGDGDNAYARVL